MFFKLLAKPLRESATIPDSEMTVLFSNLDVLIEKHRKLLSRIEERVENWNENTTMGEVFLEEVCLFVLYFMFSY
jgi:hypothetical protein